MTQRNWYEDWDAETQERVIQAMESELVDKPDPFKARQLAELREFHASHNQKSHDPHGGGGGKAGMMSAARLDDFLLSNRGATVDVKMRNGAFVTGKVTGHKISSKLTIKKNDGSSTDISFGDVAGIKKLG